MSLEEMRRRLPVVANLPPSRSRWKLPLAPGEMHRPRLAVWELTLACDQRCLHCGPRSEARRPGELSTEEALRLVDELAEIGVGEVVLIGGEAYLRDDFILVIRAIRAAGMACAVTTGGYNLTKARADAMVEAGVQSVSVSIDGLEASHDLVRNRPHSWRRAFAALSHLRGAGARIACNTQINQRSRHELLPLAELLAEAGVRAWQLQITVAHGNAADHPELILQPYMIPELFDGLVLLLDRCDELGVTVWPANNLGYFGPLEHRLRRRLGGHFGGCNAGKETIGIESDGAIKSCPTLGGAANIGGSWREHGLAAIWSRAPEIRYISRRTLDDLWGYCRGCYYAETCMAGCTAASEPLLGRPGNNPFCLHRAGELAREGLRERVEQVAPSGGQGFDNGLFRLIREHLDPELRARHGPVQIDEPRVSRLVQATGPGEPVDVAAFTAEQQRLRGGGEPPR
ncbi:MAG: radical SAM protein [Nannocystis sp.]|nr:radical SAM protein [Nannocystis sp.]